MSKAGPSSSVGRAAHGGAKGGAGDKSSGGAKASAVSAATSTDPKNSTNHNNKPTNTSPAASARKQQLQEQLAKTEEQLQQTLQRLLFVTNCSNVIVPKPEVKDGKFSI
jgi:hypothetical protein